MPKAIHLSETRQIQRHFARIYGKVKPNFWRKIMWSDECSFDTSRGITRWVIHTKGEHYHSACCESVFKSNSTFIPIWGGISYNWKSSLMFLKEHEKQREITMKDYKKQVIEAVVRPAFQAEWGQKDGIFQKNNASVHETKRKLRIRKQELNIPLFDWLSSFSDLSSIENVWCLLKQWIYCQKQPSQTHMNLIHTIQKEWNQLEPKDWRKYVNSMSTRLQQVQKRRGLATDF